MLLLAGTIPDKNMPLTFGEVSLKNGSLVADGRHFNRFQGTGAMISAALATTNYLHLKPPKVLVVGDIGDGQGSRELYRYLIDNIVDLSPEVFVMHYCLPIMTLMRQLCQAVRENDKKTVMVADAGAMYAAKGAELSSEFDIMTPDPSEIAFLADPKATHPAYIAEHLFECDASKIPDQIDAAFRNGSAAKLLLVKGKTDYIASGGNILATINEPDVPMIEAIGGTGDTITGLVSALVYSGMEPKEAAIVAAKTNRVAGELAKVTPATKVAQLIDQFQSVFEKHLCQWSEVCCK